MATKKQKWDTALFGTSTVMFLAAAVMTGGLWMWVAAASSGIATGARVVAYHRKPRRKPMPPKGRKPAKRRVERPIQQGLPKQARPVTVPPPKRVGTRRCSAACQRSTKPAHTCDCSCGGRSHGAMVKGTRASLLTSGARKAEREAVRRGPVKPVAVARPPAPTRAPRAVKTPAAPSPPPASAPLRSVDEQRGWKSLQTSGKQAMASHAKASPRCVGGTATARTMRDRSTSPPTVTQSLTCDTCGARLT